jgi:hypothetical protein
MRSDTLSEAVQPPVAPLAGLAGPPTRPPSTARRGRMRPGNAAALARARLGAMGHRNHGR